MTVDEMKEQNSPLYQLEQLLWPIGGMPATLKSGLARLPDNDIFELYLEIRTYALRVMFKQQRGERLLP